MQRSHYPSTFGAPINAALMLAALSWAPVALANGALKTIYSAEHALYGAGYDIGRADGWIDDSLRAAIREYQSNARELTVTGNLDAPTLKALGVNARTESVISRNAVPARKQALAALKLEDPARSQPVSQPAPQPEPQPAPVRVAAAVQAETSVPSLPTVEAEQSSDEPLPVIKQDIAKTISTSPEVIEREVVAATQSAQSNAKTETEVKLATMTVAEPEPASTNEGTTDETELVAQLPTEPTAAGPAGAETTAPVHPTPEPATQAAPATRSHSSGGFFSSLFDFLFGWLV